VDLDGAPRDAFFDEERRNLQPLITLELDHLASLLIINEGSVTGELLLECLQELLRIVLFGQALQGRQRLPPVPLLDPDVDIVLLGTNVCVCAERVSLVCEGVENVEVLYAHATVGSA